jgi:sterol desaturase/sphingolipid hydroxylase (fatty acid hydroxylase superfamily)
MGLLNPMSFPPGQLSVLYAATRLFLLCLDRVVIRASSTFAPLRRKEDAVESRIARQDVIFLFLNSIIEFVFLQHTIVFLLSLSSPSVSFSFSSPSGPPFFLLCVWLLVVTDDLFYTPLHMLLHQKTMYRLVHKHHHKSFFPTRGYSDAGNEHPVEQICALYLHYASLLLVSFAVGGIHPLSVLVHMVLKATGAILNHSGRDIRVSLFGIDYSVRHHATHHSLLKKNFAQYVMFYDRLAGSFCLSTADT